MTPLVLVQSAHSIVNAQSALRVANNQMTKRTAR